MSLEHDALDLLQRTAVEAKGVVASQLGGEKGTPLLYVPNGIRIEDVEHFLPGRNRYRGKFVTKALAEFIGYTLGRVEAGAQHPQVYVDSSADSAKAYFNLGTLDEPGHGDDVALLGLERTAAYEELGKYTVRSFRQKDIAEFLEDWFECVTPFYWGDDQPAKVSVSAAVAAIRDITIAKQSEVSSEEKDLAASRSSFASIEAKSKNRLPSGFRFVCQPYDGFQDRTFDLRLVVTSDDKGPLLALRIVAKSDIEEQIAKEFEAKVREGLPSINVYRGTFTP